MNLDNLFRRFLGLHRVDALSLAPSRDQRTWTMTDQASE